MDVDHMADVFSVYEGCYAYAAECHSGQWSRAYALMEKLDKKGFRPGLSVRERGFEALDYRGKETYSRMLKAGY